MRLADREQFVHFAGQAAVVHTHDRPGVFVHQLSNVRWSAVFDDLELTAAEIAELAKQARPLVQSRGTWIELDRVDLAEAAAALAERANRTQLTGAEPSRCRAIASAALPPA